MGCRTLFTMDQNLLFSLHILQDQQEIKIIPGLECNTLIWNVFSMAKRVR